MSFQAYLDNIKAKTGKGPDEFRALATKKGLVKRGELVAWLKADFDLGHGHASAIASAILQRDRRRASPDDRLEALFPPAKAHWRPSFGLLAARIAKFGPDVEITPNLTYVNVLRAGKKFAILQVSSAARFDVGIKFRGEISSKRLEAARSWNRMVMHRVRVTEPRQIDAELVAWLRLAYDNA